MKKLIRIISLCLAVAVVMSALACNITANAVETGKVEDLTYIVGSELYYTDFENDTVGSISSGWEMAMPSWGWNSGKVASAAVTENSTYGKVLTFTSTSNDAFLSMPEIKTKNYIYEANVLIEGTNTQTFGIANGMYGGMNSATGARYTAIPINNGSGVPYYRGKGSCASAKYEFTVASDTQNNGSVVNLKFVTIDDMNYYYHNGVYIGAFPRAEITDKSDWAGFFTCGVKIHIIDVKVTEIPDPKLSFVNAAVRTDGTQVDLNVTLSFDKSNSLYADNYSEDYAYSDTAALKFGAVYSVSDSAEDLDITLETEGVNNCLFISNSSDESNLYFELISAVAQSELDSYFIVRPYILIGSDYFYSDARSYSPARIASSVYSASDEQTKALLDSAFAASSVFKGANAKKLTFSLFSDFHYKENMYTVSIADLRSILKRAEEADAAFILSGGDFCNDFAGSPELTNTYLNYELADGSVLSAYNIYGNHELETTGNSMDNVTATLTNDENVVWGTEDGSFDANIGYYYFERGGFRIVCTDTNYSYDSANAVWEHNEPASYGAPSGNTLTNSLGPTQLAWLETVLTDAANAGIPCIVISHDGFSGKFATSSSDAEAVREIYARVNGIKAGTVIMSINGHHHTNHQGYNDGVFYFDMNTTRNGYWYQTDTTHYPSDATYTYEEYDSEGNLLSTYEKTINSLYQAKNTWFFADPLSAIVTVDEFGTVTIDGMESSWMYDVVPDTAASGVEPKVTSGVFWDCDSLGHKWSGELCFNDTHHWYSCENTACPSNDVTLNSGYSAHTFEEVESENAAVSGAQGLYYKSCYCGALSTEVFGEGAMPEEKDIWDGTYADSYAGGTGTEADPYLIDTPEQLARMIGYDVLKNFSGNTSNGTTDKHYKLTSDIYLNDVTASDWYTASGLNIWYSATTSRFTGNIDGNGHTVYGLYFDSAATNAGLIPVVDFYHADRYIKSLSISKSYVKASSMAGALTSRVYGGVADKTLSITDCYIDGSVIVTSDSDSAWVGGLIGYSSTGNTTVVSFKNTACLAKGEDGSRLSYGLVGITLSWYAESYLKAENCFAYCDAFQGLTFRGSLTNSYVITDLTSIMGSAASTSMPNLEGFYITSGYPANTTIGRLIGDVTGDRAGNALDLAALRRNLLTGEAVALGDLNADGTSDIKDLVNLKKTLAQRNG